MTKYIRLIFICIVTTFFAHPAKAAIMQVLFSGDISDGGTYIGYFTYDSSLFGDNSFNSTGAPGYEINLGLSIVNSAAANGYDQDTASVSSLNFSGGVLTSWRMGGDRSEPGGFSINDLPDFYINTNLIDPGFGYAQNTLNSDQVRFTSLDYSVTNISVVPLPAAFWAFGAALMVFAGFYRRRNGRWKTAVGRC
ncbi:MAG: VPLPA-CTERM sorting domain-containing protein [Sneathiellales bacterium]|nr:VPLPA-CTERM sorting domain-containing protein [Sneathiellales bacterium]